LYGAPAMSLTW